MYSLLKPVINGFGIDNLAISKAWLEFTSKTY